MSACAPWLPRAALVDEVIVTHLRAIVDAWSTAWMAQPRRAELRQFWGVDFAGVAASAQGWTANDVTLVLDPRAPLGAWLLGLNAPPQRPNEADTQILSALLAAAVVDLFARLHLTLDLRDEPRADIAKRADENALVFSIGLGNATNLLHLFVPVEIATTLRKRLAGAPFPPTRSPKPRTEALLRQDIRVGAMLGRARVAIADVRSLAPGDVIVLDRGEADLLDLTINGDIVEAWCGLGGAGDATALRLRPFHSTSEDAHP